jgi:hypothetical protein
LKYVSIRNIVALSLNQLYCDEKVEYSESEQTGLIKMDIIETMLSKKIKEQEPTLDILGADRKVLQVAHQDFTTYLKFNRNLADKETNILDHPDKVEQLHKEDPAEIESFLTVWTGLWLKKWKKRVNLLIGKQNQSGQVVAPETLAKTESLWTKLECREEMIEIVSATLIKNAEICGTKIIAENLLKTELRKKNDQDINNKEQVLAVLNNALRQAREIAQRTGPLISLKVDKSYYLPNEQLEKVGFFRKLIP